jgi:hypothetical protein
MKVYAATGNQRPVTGPAERRRHAKSPAEIEAIASVSQSLLALERAAGLADAQLVALAQAIDAMELGAFDAARALAAQSLLRQDAEVAVARAHIVVQELALAHLSHKFMRLAAGDGERGRELRPPPPRRGTH